MKTKETVIQLCGTFTGDALLCAMILKGKLVRAYSVYRVWAQLYSPVGVEKCPRHGSSEWLKNTIHVIPWYSSKHVMSDVTFQLHFLPQISKAKAQQIKYISDGSKQVWNKAQWMLLISAI